MQDAKAEMLQSSEAGRMAHQRRLAFLAVGLVGLVGAVLVQRSTLSLHTAPAFVAALLGLLGAGEITVRILDRYEKKKRQTSPDLSQDSRIRHLLDNLSWGSVVLHDVPAGNHTLTHLLFRPEGLVFLVESHAGRGDLAAENGELRLNGRKVPEALMEETRRKVDWVRKFIHAQLGCDPRLEAGLVFPNAEVAACYRSEGIALLGIDHLQPWLETTEPCEEFGKRLWPGMAQLKTELLAGSRASSHPLVAVPAMVVLVLGVSWLLIGGREQPVRAAVAAPIADRIKTAVSVVTSAVSVAASTDETPSQPSWLKDIHLEGVGGAASNRLAIINRKTIAVGEGAVIRVGERNVYIRCLEISGESATINVAGVEGNIAVRLSDN